MSEEPEPVQVVRGSGLAVAMHLRMRIPGDNADREAAIDLLEEAVGRVAAACKQA